MKILKNKKSQMHQGVEYFLSLQMGTNAKCHSKLGVIRPIWSNKKSQMQIQEMSFMIIALAVFFILVLLFYLAFSLSGLKKTVEAGTRQGAILLVSQLAGSPEFSCPDGGSQCVDTDKIISLMNHPEYARFWDVAGLRIERVYPFENRTIECNEGNYPRCTTFTIISKKTENVIEDASYVSLCREEYKNGYSYTECELGKIIVASEKTTS